MSLQQTSREPNTSNSGTDAKETAVRPREDSAAALAEDASSVVERSPFAMHPLTAQRRPGPKGQDAPPPADADLEHAAAILDLIESGDLDVAGTPTPLSIPCDATGRPRRRLTPEDEHELAYRIQRFGDVEARNVLVMANLGLVHLMANQMRRQHIRYEDMVQEGTLGLLRATETFDPGRGVRFSTYCVYWIRAKLQRFLQKIDKDEVPSVPGAHLVENEKGQRKRPRARALSFDKPVEAGEDRTLGDVIAAKGEDPEDVSLRTEREIAAREVLHTLVDEMGDPRLRTIVEHRLLTEDPQTLAVVGKMLNLSREGARLLENKLLKQARVRLMEHAVAA